MLVMNYANEVIGYGSKTAELSNVLLHMK